MLSRFLTLVHTVAEMYPFGKRWNRRLEEILSASNLSRGASEFIRQENNKSESGREGYIGKASYLMEGEDSRDPIADSIWLDSSLHLFGLRVVDDYFDDYDRDVPFDAKRERINWNGITKGIRSETYDSPQEEAAVFLLQTLVERFIDVPDYLELADRLYNAVCNVEDTTQDLKARKKIDLEVASLTVEPVTRLGIPYGITSSTNVQNAIKYLARGTRIWDYLGDLDKDSQTGAFNFVLEDAMNNVKNGESPLRYIKRQSGKKFIEEATQELERGKDLLVGEPMAIYQTLRTLMTLKYGTEYFLNTRFENSGYRNILGKALRSI